MKIFFDTEFTGLHQNTTLISIGLVAENGRHFYAEFIDYDKNQVDSWIEENVIKYLKFKHITFNTNGESISDSYKSVEMCNYKNIIKDELFKWLHSFNTDIEFWSDCLAYDWILLCELFGGAMSMPNWIYYIPFDICTMFQILNIDPDVNREQYAYDIQADALSIITTKHNSLWDAFTIQACYKKLNSEIKKLNYCIKIDERNQIIPI